MRRIALVMVMLAGCIVSVSAKVEVLRFSTPENETRYKNLVAELRCLVCQNQNIASSNADLAKDLRQQVYSRIENGESDEQIIAYMVERYGDFVLYNPPINATTIVLWFGPFLLLGLGILAMLRVIRSRNSGTEISEASVERARNLLKNKHKTS